MTTYTYEHVVHNDGSEELTLVSSDGAVHTADPDTHPNFDDLLDAAITGDHDFIDRNVDQGQAIRSGLTALSDRVSVSGDVVYFDGDAMDNALSRHLLRMIADGEDFDPIVRFMERLADNPSTVSRVSLWTWLNANDFTITRDGKIVGYKGVRDNLQSISRGVEDVFVNGAVHVGHIPNNIGATIGMDRDLIDESRTTACSRGLHVGTWDYASGFGSTVLTVVVDPANVVAVPSDSGGQKMRVCEYEVVNATTASHDVSVLDL